MPLTVDVPDLALRRRPAQSRSVATFDQILDTTASLLAAHGFDSLTTNLISAASGVSVRAIYRYFPNKHAIVGELARRMAGQWNANLAQSGDLADPASPWRDVWRSYIDAFVDGVRSTPGAQAVLVAMRGHPELRKADDEANDAYIEGVADAVRARKPGVTAEEAVALATVLIRSTVAVLDEAFEADESTAARLITLMTEMHVGLLAPYLD